MMLRYFSITWLFISLANANAAERIKNDFVIGRAPQVSSATLTKQWSPLIHILNENTEYKFRLKVYDRREDFEHDLVKGRLDFFFGNPGYYVIANELYGAIPLVRSSNKKLKGIIVVDKKSAIHSINKLNNKQIAFPDKNAFAASLYLRSILKTGQKLVFTPLYLDGHDNVYRAVATGHVTAGAGVYRTFNSQPPSLKSGLRIIYETPGMQPHPLVAHSRIPKSVRDKVSRIILDLDKTEHGRSMLKILKLNKPVLADYDRDYKSIRNMALDMYQPLLHAR